MQAFSADLQDFLRLLHRHAVRYVVVGGAAVIHHGYPRFTGDVDFFYERTEENTRRLYDCLAEFWNGSIPEINDPSELMEEAVVFQFGRPPHRIDLLNTIDGVDFALAWQSRVEAVTGGVPVHYIGKEALVANKQASGRYKDLDDIEHLNGENNE